MKQQRRVVQAAPGVGIQRQSGSPGGGVEPFAFGSNASAQQRVSEGATRDASTPLLDSETEGVPDPAVVQRNREKELDPDACIVEGGRTFQYWPVGGERGAAEIITSSHRNSTTNDDYSASRKFLADREGYGSERSAWKHAVGTDANVGGSVGTMGGADFEVTGNQIAVVVGNSAYDNVASLPGVKADASAMKGYYEGLGFTSFGAENLKGSQLSGVFGAAGGGAQPGDHLVLFYAGHGTSEGALGVDGAPDGSSGLMGWSVMVGIANTAVSKGYKATIVMDSCGSDALQHAAVNAHPKRVFSERLMMNAQSESSPEAWERLDAQNKKMGVDKGMDRAGYQFMMEKRHGLRASSDGAPVVATKN